MTDEVARKVERYDERLRLNFLLQNRLFETGKEQLNKQIGRHTCVLQIEQVSWSELWAYPVEQNEEESWLKDSEKGSKTRGRWKLTEEESPRTWDNVQGFWLKI